jgi:hypothetical protein
MKIRENHVLSLGSISSHSCAFRRFWMISVGVSTRRPGKATCASLELCKARRERRPIRPGVSSNSENPEISYFSIFRSKIFDFFGSRKISTFFENFRFFQYFQKKVGWFFFIDRCRISLRSEWAYSQRPNNELAPRRGQNMKKLAKYLKDLGHSVHTSEIILRNKISEWRFFVFGL